MNYETAKTVTINIIVTFIQAAVATWAATGFATDKLALSGAVGAGLSAVWNVLVKPFLKGKGWLPADK